MKKIGLILFLLFYLVHPAQAIYAPQEVSNNRFGIHVIDENDLEDAKNLVNSSGGDWGYVTLVIREDDRNREKWQNAFDRMRRLHLIPLVRLATKVETGGWVKPRVADIGSWVDFLSSLNWVVENRYVIVFNEPNHAKEWGGELNPEEYAWYLKEFSRRLKEKSPDFFILPAGLDASAPNSADTLDELHFLKRMQTKEPDVFDFVDGWTSHSYPNPDFSGSPQDHGRGTIRTYLWELAQLKNFGLNSSLPVFITETGWKHSEGRRRERSYPVPEIVADYFHTAYVTAWNDEQVVAVTPFLLNYQDGPFDHFSWRRPDTEEFYPVYETIQKLVKIAGQPGQRVAAKFIESAFPQKLVTNSIYSLFIEIENTGQSLIGGSGWAIEAQGLPNGFTQVSGEIAEIEPFHRTRLEVKLTTPEKTGKFNFRFVLVKDDKEIASLPLQIQLIAPPGLFMRAQIWFRKLAEGGDFRLTIRDNERLLHDLRQIPFAKGQTEVENLYHIIPNQKYKLTLSKPFYLPQEVEAFLSEGKTSVSFPQLLPLDPSNDGRLTISDLLAFLRHPLSTLHLILTL